MAVSGRQYGSAMTDSVEMAAGMRAALNDRNEAWRFLTRFAAEWRAPVGVGNGYDPAVLDDTEARLGVRLPAALREIYGLLGRRDDLLRNQNPLLRPEQLYLSKGAMVYQTENQGAAEWGSSWTTSRPRTRQPHTGRASQMPRPSAGNHGRRGCPWLSWISSCQRRWSTTVTA